jgi:hypothetical protein
MATVRRTMPTILLVLSLPAGLLGYLLGTRIVSALAPNDLLQLFVPLLVAGLCMIPFLIPFLDRRAKEDLAAIQRLRAAEAPTPAPKPDAEAEATAEES